MTYLKIPKSSSAEKVWILKNNFLKILNERVAEGVVSDPPDFIVQQKKFAWGHNNRKEISQPSTRYTLPTADILSGKNVRAWVSMDFTYVR